MSWFLLSLTCENEKKFLFLEEKVVSSRDFSEIKKRIQIN